MGRGIVVVTLCGALSAGCILPVATGTPLPATTLGQGRIGFSMSGEAPALDLLAEGEGYSDLRGAAPAAAMTLALGYGLTDDTDLELAGEGAFYYFLIPMPTGGSLGIRHHLAATDLLDIALAGKVGGVTSSQDQMDSNGNRVDTGASAMYGAAQAVIQLRHGGVRPLVALNAMPFRIRRAIVDEPEYSFRGLAASATFGVMFVGNRVQAGPYVTVTSFTSERFAGGVFPSYGLMLAIRPDRNRVRKPAMPATPYYGPPDPGGPPPAPYGPPPPPPYGPPAPAPEPAPPIPSGPPGGPPGSAPG